MSKTADAKAAIHTTQGIQEHLKTMKIMDDYAMKLKEDMSLEAQEIFNSYYILKASTTWTTAWLGELKLLSNAIALTQTYQAMELQHTKDGKLRDAKLANDLLNSNQKIVISLTNKLQLKPSQTLSEDPRHTAKLASSERKLREDALDTTETQGNEKVINLFAS